MSCTEATDVGVERRAVEEVEVVVPLNTTATQENNAPASSPQPEAPAAGPKGDIAVIFPDKVPTTKVGGARHSRLLPLC